jgi:hypothetical protein
MTEQEECIYEQGGRAATLSMLQHCIQRLGYTDPETGKVAWVLEREAAIATLRQVCEHHGDNDWPTSLHLSDVIDKHLARYLG